MEKKSYLEMLETDIMNKSEMKEKKIEYFRRTKK